MISGAIVDALCVLMSGLVKINPDRGEKGSPGARSDGRILWAQPGPGVIMEREEEAKPWAVFGMSAARRRWS